MEKKKNIHFYSGQSTRCIACGKCCGWWPIPVTHAEVKRVSALDFSGWKYQRKSYFKLTWKGWYLRKRDGHCVFQDDDGLCIVHKRYGFDVKPLACRLYPLDVYKWDDGSVSAALRYDCPAVAQIAKEKPPETFYRSIDSFSSEVFTYRGKLARASYSPRLSPGTERLREIASAYERILLSDPKNPEVCFYAAGCLLKHHQDLKNSEDITDAEEFGPDSFSFFMRSKKYLNEVIRDAEPMRPDILMRFRYLIWCFLRDDAQSSLINHFPMAMEAVRFLFGKGTLSRTVLRLPAKSSSLFYAMEHCSPAPSAMDLYYQFLRGRLRSMHFCGNPALGLTFEEGMSFLILSYPITMAVAGILALAQKRTVIETRDVCMTLRLIDHAFLRSRLYARGTTRKCAVKVALSDDYAYLMQLLRKADPHPRS